MRARRVIRVFGRVLASNGKEYVDYPRLLSEEMLIGIVEGQIERSAAALTNGQNCAIIEGGNDGHIDEDNGQASRIQQGHGQAG
jgi:hypothetical protein